MKNVSRVIFNIFLEKSLEVPFLTLPNLFSHKFNIIQINFSVSQDSQNWQLWVAMVGQWEGLTELFTEVQQICGWAGAMHNGKLYADMQQRAGSRMILWLWFWQAAVTREVTRNSRCPISQWAGDGSRQHHRLCSRLYLLPLAESGVRNHQAKGLW